MKKLTLIIVAPFLLITSSMSLDLSSITPKIGISGNQAVYAAEGKERNHAEDGTLKHTTKEYGAFKDGYGAIFVELAVGPIALGIDYVPQKISTPTNTNSNTTGKDISAQADFEDLTTIYAKLDIPLGGLYLKAGYSTVDVIINEKNTSGNTYKDTDTSGYVAGIGYEIDLPNNVQVRAEITGTAFDDVEANNGVATTGNRNEYTVSEMIGARGTVSLVKSLFYQLQRNSFLTQRMRFNFHFISSPQVLMSMLPMCQERH
jgi:opacity protein-like surface antigen